MKVTLTAKAQQEHDAMHGTNKNCVYEWGAEAAKSNPILHWMYHARIYQECLHILSPNGVLGLASRKPWNNCEGTLYIFSGGESPHFAPLFAEDRTMNSVIHEAIRDFNSWHPGQPITAEVTKALLANPPTRVTDRNGRKRMIESMIEMYRHLDHSLVLLVFNGRPLLLEISEYQDLAEALYDTEGHFIEGS